MHPVLNQNHYFVKEHIALFKAANNFDILDPSEEVILHCREPNLGFFTKLFRFTKHKTMTPFDIHVTTPGGDPVIRITRGFTFFLSKVRVFDEQDSHIGGFKQKLFSIGGAFRVLDESDRPLCELKGKWTGWNFKFKDGNRVFAEVSKKWAGIGKEVLTSADNYTLSISEAVPPDHPLRQLILAAVLCIDMVLKEKK